MAVLNHISAIHKSPLETLEYITGKTKKEKVELITGLQCSTNPKSAYLEMGLCYKSHTGKEFYSPPNINGKQSIKMHHYVQSFDINEITPQKAHDIAVEWAKEVFGYDHQVLIATHTDTKHIHTHFAVNAYSLNGKHWLDNKETLKRCRSVSDRIVRKHDLSIIQNPEYKPNHKYGEWQARQSGTSWKVKLCEGQMQK